MRKIMKIAIDLTSYQPVFSGGKEKVILNLIKGFCRLGYESDIVIFCYDYYKEQIKELIPESNIITFKRKNCKKIIQDLYIRTFLFKKYLDGCDILFFPIYYTGFAKYRMKTIVLPHDIQFKSRKQSFSLAIRIRDSIMYYADFLLRDHIIAISEFDEKEIKKYYPRFSDKVKMIYNPIIYQEHIGQSKRENIIVINIAYSHKNIETILKAYKLLEDKISQKLILVGDAGKNSHIIKLAEKLQMDEKIIFTGHIDDKALADLFFNSALYVTASEYEGFGMVSAEAMMNRVPVVSSSQPALKEVTFNKALYYEPYNDEHKLADIIKRTLDHFPDEKYLDELKQKATANYGYLEIASQYLTFFQSITNKIFLVDPMSYHNLALYDYNLIQNISSKFSVSFFGNMQFALNEIQEIRKIYRYSNIRNNCFKAISYLNSQWTLCRQVKKEKCRLIHIQWSRMPEADCFLIKYLKMRFGIRFVYTSHDTFTHNMEKTKKKSFIKLMNCADQLIVHTEKAKKVLNEHGFTKVSVINHGLLDIYKLYQPSPVAFEKEDKVVFSLLGYMEEYKGTDLLLKAWLRSEKLMSNTKISLIVMGKNKMAYKPQIPDGSNLLYKDELIKDSEFTRWMELSDVVILPYQEISQSGLLLTALSMKKHFIVNDIGEIAYPVKKFNLGWVINEKTVEGLRMKLEDIVDHIMAEGIMPLRDDVAKQIDEEFSWEQAGAMTSSVYERLLLSD
ncbi:MAG: glycosyltransferase [Clostridia bacterium]|nr:glycosyltransferase [Clostridia bacterium]